MAGKTCGAKTKSSGKPCQKPALPNGRCRYHGGKSLAGPAHPAFTHGRYSKYMPKGLLERTREFVEDPEIMSLLPNIAIVDAQIAESLERLGEAFGRPDWEAIVAAQQALDAAESDEDRGAALAVLLAAVRRGSSTAAVRAELREQQEHRRRLVETETKRLQVGMNIVSQDQAVGLMLFLVDVMFRHVTDRDTRRAITEDVRSASAQVPGLRSLALQEKDGVWQGKA